jgi:hypothetical protein
MFRFTTTVFRFIHPYVYYAGTPQIDSYALHDLDTDFTTTAIRGSELRMEGVETSLAFDTI